MLYACIAALAAAAGGLILRSEYEKKHFVTDHYRISSKKIKGQKRDFVFLSDLHNNEFGVNNRLLIEEIDRIHPDAVLIGGDMMVSRGEADLRVTLSLVKELASRYPVYYANGNHEERMRRERTVYGGLYRKFTGELKKAGAFYLSDKSADFGTDIRITGCNMEEIYYRHRSRFRFCRRMSWSAIAAGRISRGFKSCCCIRRCFLITAATGEPI